MDKLNKTKKKFKFRLSFIDSTEQNIPCGNITYFVAAFIPLLIFVALYYAKNIFPFGTSCYLRSDMYHQYAPFFSELWHKIRNGEALTYSWDIGMGTNFLSLYAYYLASPANWFIVLFPQKYMIEIMNVLIILKLSASSVTFCYYLSKHFNTKNFTLSLFSIFYALSGYVAAYSWNIMWLDCILLLPLIMLGLERLVKENKCFLYCISLGLCIFTNYYISIMVCISVVIYFIVLIIAYDGPKKPVIYLKKCLNFGIFSLLAGGLACCLLLPEIYTFSLSASSKINFPKNFTVYFSMMELLVRHLMNIPIHLGLDHYPNIYSGVAVFILIPLYVMDRKINSREKIGKCVILLIFLLSMNINQFNFIWHGLRFPNSLPCRQGFIYTFFLISMSFEAFSHLKNFNKKQFTGAVWIALALIFVAEQMFRTSETYKNTVFYIGGAFILVYALLLHLHRTIKPKVPIVLFAAFAVTIIELTVNMDETGIGTTSRNSYLLDYDAVKTVTSQIKENDDSFYRMDKIYGARSKNDGAWHNYHSISTFSSTANAGMTTLFDSLGIVSSTNSYGYNGSTMVTNALFSVKYLITNKHLTDSSLRSYLTGYDGEFIYQNTKTLPIGYMVPSDFEDNWSPNTVLTAIDNQNSMIYNMTGIKQIFKQIREYNSETDVTFTSSMNGHLYLIASDSRVKSLSLSIGDRAEIYSDLDNGRAIVDAGYVTTDDIINVSAENPMQLKAYILDEALFNQAIDKLNHDSINIDSWSDTKITGTVNASYDGTFLLSIPYDAGWTVYVDGKKTATHAVEDALLGFNLSAGEHTIKLVYTPVNFVAGCIITFVSIIILISLYLFKKFIKCGKISIDNFPLFVRELICEEDITFKKPEKLILTQNEIEQLKDEMDDFENIELYDDLIDNNN